MDDTQLSLNEDEVRHLVRLLADALAPDDGRSAKVSRLMAGLCQWVDADGWFWVRSRLAPATSVPENYDFLYGGGLDERHLAVWSERSLEVHGRPAENLILRQRLLEQRHFTLTRPEVLPDKVWQEPAQQEFVQRLGHDAVVFSVRTLDELNGGQLVSYVQMLRKVGKPEFDRREARLIHAVLSECGPLHSDTLNLSNAGEIAALTPRERSVLAMLIDGHSVKQAAHRLSLSPHTVNDHCKEIYKHFGVTSRGELLRRFMNGHS